MIIHSNLKDYEIIWHDKLSFLSELLKMENMYVVIDSEVYRLYRDYFFSVPEKNITIILAEEKNKAIETVLSICESMTELSAKRNARLLSFGGGIVQDITGFAANILYRGIHWTFVPTTLLAACDSCIGGKTSLNYKNYKNLLGTFYPPDEIHICPLFFKTLSDRDFESGLGEVIKFNIMAGKEGLNYIQNKLISLLNRDEEALSLCVKKSLDFKKEFIEVDEFDRGERIKLNFAHTFGHAIEAVTNYIIPHGTSVAIGMIIANHISLKRGFIDSQTVCLSTEVLLQVIHIDISLLEVPLEKILLAMKKDKKQINNQLTAVLMTDTPKDLVIVHDITVQEVESALDNFVNCYKTHMEITKQNENKGI